MLCVFSTSLKAFLFLTVDLCPSRGCNKSYLLWPSRCCFVLALAYLVYNQLIAPSGVCPMHLALCDFALVLFLAEIALYCAFHFILSCLFFIYYIRFAIGPLYLSIAVLLRSSDNNAKRLKTNCLSYVNGPTYCVVSCLFFSYFTTNSVLYKRCLLASVPQL